MISLIITSPAALLARLTPEIFGNRFWTIIILIYYVLATLLPIDKIIGKLYPVFGAALITMALGILVGIISGGYRIPEISFTNLCTFYTFLVSLFYYLSFTKYC